MTKLLCCSSAKNKKRNRGAQRHSTSTASSGSESDDNNPRERNRRKSKKRRRRRATYRYEVVYRREECFSADYLDHFRPAAITDGHISADVTDSQLRPVQPTPAAPDYSLLSNYGRLEDLTSNWRTQESYEENDQPLYQNYSGGLSKDLREYLTTRFAKGSVDHELQTTIRDNLYLRTVPVTTRPARPGETDGLDYTFLNLDQFRQLEKSGSLLERGIYDGNYYGTPKPGLDSPLVLPSAPLAQSSTAVLPQLGYSYNRDQQDFHQYGLPTEQSGGLLLLAGAHPSSEGKRRRNRSNVEAMAAAQQHDGDHHRQHLHHESGAGQDSLLSAGDPSMMMHGSARTGAPAPLSHSNSGLTTTSSNNMTIPSYREDGGGAMGGLSEAELGPLPTNWEKAYTERGEVYFIDHNTGTSQWLDPRLSKIQKKSLEECAEDELPYGWEKIDDPTYGTYYIDHVNRKTQYENPVTQAKKGSNGSASTSSPGGPTTNGNVTSPPGSTSIGSNGNQQTAPGGPTTGNASSTDSGNSTYPRLKRQQQSGNNNNNNDNNSSSGGVNSNNNPSSSAAPPPAPLPKRSNSESRLNLYYGGYGHQQQRPFFTRNPSELQGERICTTLLKSNRGLGFTIVGGDDSEEEFLQIKSVVPHGPAWVDGRLQTGDVLVYVLDQCVLGYTHHDMVNMFQSIAPGQAVALEVCRGYPLPFDPNDPNTEIVTTVAVAQQQQGDGHKTPRPGSADLLQQQQGRDGDPSTYHPTIQEINDMAHRFDVGDEYGPDGGMVNGGNMSGGSGSGGGKVEYLTVQITKGAMGFGFTIADSAYGQKVKTILDRPRCKNLQEGDILVDINGINMRIMTHADVVQVLKDCPWGREASITVQRGGAATPTKNKWKKGGGGFSFGLGGGKDPLDSQPPVSPRKPPVGAGLFRSKTPTADLYSAQTKEVVPIRPKTPLVDTRNRPKTPSMGVGQQQLREQPSFLHPTSSAGTGGDQQLHDPSRDMLNRTPVNVLAEQFQNGINFHQDGQTQTQQRSMMNRSRSPGRELDSGGPSGMSGQQQHYENGLPPDASYQMMPNGYPGSGPYESDYGHQQQQRHRGNNSNPYTSGGGNPSGYNTTGSSYAVDPSSRQMDYGYGYTGMNGPAVPDYPEENLGQFHRQDSGYGTQPQSVIQMGGYGNNHTAQRHQQQQSYAPLKEGHSFEHELVSSGGSGYLNQQGGRPRPATVQGLPINGPGVGPGSMGPPGDWLEMNVTLLRHETGFGFRIVGGTEEGSQVSIGHIVPGGAADLDGRLRTGDEILGVDQMSVVHTSHHHVVQLMGAAALNGRVSISVRRWIPAHPASLSPQDGYSAGVMMGEGSMAGTIAGSLGSGHPTGNGGVMYPYDVTVMRREDEGFGFVIISSVTKGVSFIGQIIRDSPAERCARLHVGDRILAVNRHDISRLHHGDIVNLIKDSGYTVTLTVGPPLDDGTASSNASNSHRSSDAMVTAQALPAPPASDGTRSPSREAYHQHLQQQQQYNTMSSYSQDDQIDGPMIDGSEATLMMEEDQLYAVELSRGTRGFGFSIRGGREFHNMPLFVLRIADQGAAAQDGRLRVGDQLIEINGITTKNMAHADAIELIKNGGPVVRLLLRRGNIAPPMGENGQMMSPSSTGSPTNPSGHMDPMMMRPNSSMAQPTAHMGTYNSNQWSTSGSSLPGHHQQQQPPNGGIPGHHQSLQQQHSYNMNSGPASTSSYLMGPRGAPNGTSVGMLRGHVPAPLSVPRNHLNGPLGHSSPRVIGTNVGPGGGDYYWGS